jgi:tRNA(Ile)-lysidine synthase
MIFCYPQGRVSNRGELGTPEGNANEFKIELPGPGSYEIAGLHKKLTVEYIEESSFPDEAPFPTGDFLDGGLFTFPLILRSSQPGDRFHPLGAPGSKKVSNFLSEQKIDRAARTRVVVLCADDTILALPGLRIDHRYRITDKTRQVLKISLEDI